jgi:hypothetical protein
MLITKAVKIEKNGVQLLNKGLARLAQNPADGKGIFKPAKVDSRALFGEKNLSKLWVRLRKNRASECRTGVVDLVLNLRQKAEKRRIRHRNSVYLLNQFFLR